MLFLRNVADQSPNSFKIVATCGLVVLGEALSSKLTVLTWRNFMISRGACLCGGVRYEINVPLKDPVACHCSQCARTSGNFAAMAAFLKDGLTILSDSTLCWFKSSPEVSRGFCGMCGSNLFWTSPLNPEVYVTAGTLERPTRIKLSEHIFVGSKSDFYELDDALPKKMEW